jgi:hypothetical protein
MIASMRTITRSYNGVYGRTFLLSEDTVVIGGIAARQLQRLLPRSNAYRAPAPAMAAYAFSPIALELEVGSQDLILQFLVPRKVIEADDWVWTVVERIPAGGSPLPQ